MRHFTETRELLKPARSKKSGRDLQWVQKAGDKGQREIKKLSAGQ